MKYIIPLVTVQIIALGLLWLVFRKQISAKGDKFIKVLLIGFARYMTVLLFFLLNPVYYYRRMQFSTSRVNLILFQALVNFKENPMNFITGIVFFIPLGYLVVLFHPGKTIKKKILSCISITILLSLTIEIAQMWTGRVTDIDDIILNTLGCVIGASLCMLEQKMGVGETKIGRFLLPKIQEEWKGWKQMQLYCNILGILAFASILILNYMVTRPDYKNYTYDGQTLELEAKNIAVKSEETGDYVFEVEKDEHISPASTMKILATLTAMDYVSGDDVIHLGSEVYAPPIDCSKAGLEPGMDVTVHQLLEGAMLPSGADAIYALGTYCGRMIADDQDLSVMDAMQVFADAMNEKAKSLGANDTHVINPDGYDADGQYTTANDLLLITEEFLKNPELAEICNLSSDDFVVNNNKEISLTNTNQMIQKDSIYYNSDIAGVKTGTTSGAGNCLISVFAVDGQQYICAVMGSTYDGKFRDTKTLFDYCQNQ